MPHVIQQSAAEKKAYVAPCLTVHGAVRDLTRMPVGSDDGSCPITQVRRVEHRAAQDRACVPEEGGCGSGVGGSGHCTRAPGVGDPRTPGR